ncbi:cupin domain-containing protein [Streptomyces sp. GC420]|nr:cupin domain-containing protein [Streptomyces sp. GC420]
MGPQRRKPASRPSRDRANSTSFTLLGRQLPTPSLGTVVKVCDALGVSIASVLDYEQGPRVRVVAAEQAVRLWHTDAGSHSLLLAGTDANGPLGLWKWHLEPGEGSGSDPHPPGTFELIHVTAGTLTLVVDGTEHLVPAGASASFEANTPHSYRNKGTEALETTMAVSVPPAR